MKDLDASYLKLAECFYQATKHVYETMLGESVEHDPPRFAKEGELEGQIHSFIDMNGAVELDGKKEKVPFNGVLMISWPESSYIKIASAMLGEDYKEINEDNKDVGLEISNIVMGNAKKELNPCGYKVEMSTPSFDSNKMKELKSYGSYHPFVIPMRSKLGDFFIQINYAIKS